MEQFGALPIGTQLPSEFVGIMSDPSNVYTLGLLNCIVVESICPLLMCRFHDGANKELEPQLVFHFFQIVSSIDRAWKFLVASSPEHDIYHRAQNYRVKIGHWTKK